MTNAEIKQVLLNKNVQHLYHTNTVETSISFLKCNGLMSRGYCQDKNLPQTYQYTDNSDKRYGIFYDIFFDSIEIQERTGISYYGPVMFVYSIDVLDTVKEGHIRITKMNPEKWTPNMSISEKYFMNINELATEFVKGDFGQHITLTNQVNPLSFDYLEKVVLSDPQQKDNSLYQIAEKTLRPLISSICGFPLTIRDYAYTERFFDTYTNANKLQCHYGLGGHI